MDESMMKQNIKCKNKGTFFIILFAFIMVILSSSNVFAAFISGYSEIKNDGSLTLNSSLLNVVTGSISRIYITNSGLVGIGTTTPLQTLVVVGTVNITDSLNVSGTIEATTFIGDGSSLTGISSATPPWNSSGTNVYLNDSTAKVGIGTASPATTLDVIGNITFRGNLNVTGSTYFGTQSFTNIDASGNIVGKGNITINNTVLFVNRDSGRVGIGTASPSAALDIGGGSGQLADGAEDLLIKGDLEIDDDVRIDGGSITTSVATTWDLVNSQTSALNIESGLLNLDTSNSRVGIGNTIPNNTLDVSGNANVSGILHASGVNVSGTVEATTFIGDGSSLTGLTTGHPWNSSGTNLYLNDSTAKVGIGTATPLQTLVVVGTVNITDSLNVSGTIEATTFIGDGSSLTGLTTGHPWNSSGTTLYLNDSTAKVGIGISSPTRPLHVIGTANISQSLFVGGNITTGGADFAEMMFSDENLVAGDVVCFVDALKVKKCDSDSDKSVAGVVSSNPTIIGNDIGGKYPIGIVGLVNTKVLGPLDKFDLVTTSADAGYAKKASINDFGAILGKSLENCEEESCIVKALVSLS